MRKQKLSLLLIIYVFVLILYHPVFNTYFAQDDFFHIKAALTDGSLKSFIKLFGIYRFDVRGYAFYRPIFREGLYNVFYSLFGLNPLPFRVLTFVIHFVNIYLVYLLIFKLFKKTSTAFFASFFFGITTANVAALYFMSAGLQTMGATMFMLLSLISFMNKRRVYCLLFFTLALASHELSITTPVLLSGLIFIQEKNFKTFIRKVVKYLWPHFLLTIAFLYISIFYIGFSSSEVQYQPVLSIKKTINSLAWYSAWSLGLPEMLIDFVRPGLKLDPRLMKFWGAYFKIIFPSFFLSLILIFYTGIRQVKIFLNKKILFLIFWFPISLLPVLFLPSHKLSYYLIPALPAFWGVVSFFVTNSKKNIQLLIFICLLILSISSIKLGEKTYWMVNRGRIANILINQSWSKYPSLPKGAIIYIKNDPNYEVFSQEWGSTSKQAFYALSGPDAFQLLYDDPTLQVFYEDISKPDTQSLVYEFTAVID